MASHRTKRGVRAGIGITAIAVAVMALVPAPALALPPAHQQPPPPPDTASEALNQYKQLTSQSEQVNEDLQAAKVDLDTKKAQLAQANADLAEAKSAMTQAKADEEAFRGQVDNLTSASFQGARFNKLSALLTGSSAEDFLERASALGVLASDNEEALSKLTGAVNQAADAQSKAADAAQRATAATNAAQQLANKVSKTKSDLDAQIGQVKDAYDRLSGADKGALAGEEDNSVYLGPAGAGGGAAEAAMSKRGKPYVWGAAGPNSFDCSGLTMWAYNQVGISLPHSSRAQFGYGKSVSSSQLVAGDLLFYGSSPGSIHHVAMYIGGGMLVHASTSGTPVKTGASTRGGGSDFLGAKRIAG